MTSRIDPPGPGSPGSDRPGSERPGSGAAARGRLPELAAFLSQSQLFANVGLATCEQVVAQAMVRDYARGEFLFHQGSPLRSVMVLLTGCVKMTQLGADGNEIILWLRRSGQALGVFGIPGHGVYTCSARAVAPVRALVWEWEKLNRSAAGAEIYSNIGRIVSEQLLELEERFREIATEKVARRVASAIVRLQKQIGIESENGVEIMLSREELAQLTGTTVFSVSRLISKWSDARLLQARRESLVVHDGDLLAQIDSEE